MNKLLHTILLLSIIILLPFHSSFAKEPLVETSASNSKVILITIDGVRWQDVFNGNNSIFYKGKKLSARELLPNLYHYFVDQGMVIGRDSPFVATGPAHISLPGYLEIMRGHPSTDCQNNECNPKLDVTMADLFDTSAVFASWDTIRKTISNRPDRFVINCGRNYRSQAWKDAKLPDETNFPEYFGPIYRPDSLTQKAVLEYLKDNNPQFLWVSLGDTDEWAHAGNYDKYIDALIESDKFVGQLIQMKGTKDFTFIVTADHGRSSDWRSHGWDIESAKDWLMLAGRNVPAKGFVSFHRTKSLSNIFPTVKELITNSHVQGSLLKR